LQLPDSVDVTLPNGTSASYVYDAEGRRVQQTSCGAVTNYLWDEASTYGDVVLETDGSGATQASYVVSQGEVLAQTRGGATSYSLFDGQGSVRGLTNSAGTAIDSYSYDAFGALLSSSGSTVNPYRYTGQQVDSLIGLIRSWHLFFPITLIFASRSRRSCLRRGRRCRRWAYTGRFCI
jgi:YD repeat-containing protein